MVVEAEVHETYHSEIDSDREDSDNEASNEDIGLGRKTVKSQEAKKNATSSFVAVHEPKKTSKLKIDTIDCDFILVENASVLNTVRSWTSEGKLPNQDQEPRLCRDLLG